MITTVANASSSVVEKEQYTADRAAALQVLHSLLQEIGALKERQIALETQNDTLRENVTNLTESRKRDKLERLVSERDQLYKQIEESKDVDRATSRFFAVALTGGFAMVTGPGALILYPFAKLLGRVTTARDDPRQFPLLREPRAKEEAIGEIAAELGVTPPPKPAETASFAALLADFFV